MVLIFISGRFLSGQQLAEGLQYIHTLAVHLPNVNENEVLENIAEFRSNTGYWQLKFVQEAAKNERIPSITFWKGICTQFPLRIVAEAILAMPATSAATERSFSSYGGIHSKKRNRLTNKRAGMLTYVSHNLKLVASDSSGLDESSSSLNFAG